MTVVQKTLVGLVLVGLRQRKITQKQLAAEVGLSEKHLSALLNGRTEGTLSTWQRLLDSTGVARL